MALTNFIVEPKVISVLNIIVLRQLKMDATFISKFINIMSMPSQSCPTCVQIGVILALSDPLEN